MESQVLSRSCGNNRVEQLSRLFSDGVRVLDKERVFGRFPRLSEKVITGYNGGSYQMNPREMTGCFGTNYYLTGFHSGK